MGYFIKDQFEWNEYFGMPENCAYILEQKLYDNLDDTTKRV